MDLAEQVQALRSENARLTNELFSLRHKYMSLAKVKHSADEIERLQSDNDTLLEALEAALKHGVKPPDPVGQGEWERIRYIWQRFRTPDVSSIGLRR